jgi:murein DD-endopeptidase MepM/ murein hydrolase activator NlpD
MTRHAVRFGWLLAAGALLLAGLACARGDVTVTQAVPDSEPAITEAPVSPTPLTPTVPPSPTVAISPTPAEPVAPVSPTPPPTPTPNGSDLPSTVLYEVQPGDTLRSLAIRFGVLAEEISVVEGQLPPENELLGIGQLLVIPRRLGPTGPAQKLLPDSEFVFSPHAVDFDAAAFANEQGGFLGEYQEFVYGGWHSGGEVIELAARDNSVNPRLLMAVLEYESGWVRNPTRPEGDNFSYPLGHKNPQAVGLFRQLTWLANAMGEGYYAWRMGTLTELSFSDTTVVRLAPEINAATAAIQTFYAQRLTGRSWAEAVSEQGLLAVYQTLFGDPWQYQHPLFEPGIVQPELILPFLPEHTWAFTGGPHGAWEREAAWAALDFAPPSIQSGCVDSDEWVVASAPGLVLRASDGVVVLDLDGDGREQTGWVLIYLHVSDRGRVQIGDFVELGDLLGHPSCEGGIATGTHVHLARKYNGEWILADGPLPFTLSGWVARAGVAPYQGALVNGDQTVLACTCASSQTYIKR